MESESESEEVRLHVVVDLAGRHGQQRVLKGSGRLVQSARFPDVVEALTADAACQMGVELASH